MQVCVTLVYVLFCYVSVCVFFSLSFLAFPHSALIKEVKELRPQEVKGDYFLSASVCSTMGPGVKLSVTAFPFKNKA